MHGRRRQPARRLATAVSCVAALALATGCSGSPASRTSSASSPDASPSAVASVPSSSEAPTPSPSRTSSIHRPTPSATHSATAHATKAHAPKTARTSVAAAVVPAGTGPVIVLDPGHSPTIDAIDPATGLNVSDYANEPEMRDVFAVALLVRTTLLAAGYRVVMTKTGVYDRVSLGARAAVANRVHAALAVSIHDQAGANGGIGFNQGNNTVYYQSVGDYRATAAGKKVYFTDSALAAVSKRYGAIFEAERAREEGHSVALLGNVGYNLGSRGLAPGNIWLVQLLSHVPWIYNEAGGNSAGQSGLDTADEHRYADGLVAAVESCVPVTH